jgi:hypothetical protein
MIYSPKKFLEHLGSDDRDFFAVMNASKDINGVMGFLIKGFIREH